MPSKTTTFPRIPSANVLAENVERLRNLAARPFTQTEIAQAAGIDQSTIGRILAVSHVARLDKLDGLAAAFGVEPWQLLKPGMKLPAGSVDHTLSAIMAAYEAMPAHRKPLLGAIARVLADHP